MVFVANRADFSVGLAGSAVSFFSTTLAASSKLNTARTLALRVRILTLTKKSCSGYYSCTINSMRGRMALCLFW